MHAYSPSPAVATQRAGEVDFDIHGLAGVRLINASAAEAAAVTRQLGPLQGALDREPDIVVRFVDQLETGPAMRFLGVAEAGSTDDTFLVLRGKHKSPAKVAFDFGQLGGQTEIVCERGVAAVPLLIPILNLALLARGILPLHASAFVHEGRGVVVTGWSKGGKTEALLAFARRGAEYVGDEWVYISPDGGSVFGIPEPIRLWHWHLRQLPEIESTIGNRERTRLRALQLLLRRERALRRIGGERLIALLRGQHHVDVLPERLFGGLGQLTARFDRLFLLVSHAGRDTSIDRIDPLEIGRRMVYSLRHESLDLTAAYLKFRFAFPDAGNPFLAQMERLQRELLERAVVGKPAYIVRHPYPCSLSVLFDVMSPYA
jgi:hypothetical protein